MKQIYNPEEPTYEDVLRENGRLRGRLAEKHKALSWTVALNIAMLCANVYMFGRMLEFVVDFLN